MDEKSKKLEDNVPQDADTLAVTWCEGRILYSVSYETRLTRIYRRML